MSLLDKELSGHSAGSVGRKPVINTRAMILTPCSIRIAGSLFTRLRLPLPREGKARLGRLSATCLYSFTVAIHAVWSLNLAKSFFETMSFGNAEPNQFAQHVIDFSSSWLVY